MRSKNYVESNIKHYKTYTSNPQIADIVKGRPGWVTVAKLGLRLQFKFQVIEINIFGLDHQAPNILYKMRRVRILFRVAVSMVHPVHYGVSPWVQKR